MKCDAHLFTSHPLSLSLTAVTRRTGLPSRKAFRQPRLPSRQWESTARKLRLPRAASPGDMTCASTSRCVPLHRVWRLNLTARSAHTRPGAARPEHARDSCCHQGHEADCGEEVLGGGSEPRAVHPIPSLLRGRWPHSSGEEREQQHRPGSVACEERQDSAGPAPERGEQRGGESCGLIVPGGRLALAAGCSARVRSAVEAVCGARPGTQRSSGAASPSDGWPNQP